jgi:hypothetical protein
LIIRDGVFENAAGRLPALLIVAIVHELQPCVGRPGCLSDCGRVRSSHLFRCHVDETEEQHKHRPRHAPSLPHLLPPRALMLARAQLRAILFLGARRPYLCNGIIEPYKAGYQ